MRILFLMFLPLLGALYAQDSWYEKFHPSFEAGLFMNDFDGDISNATPSEVKFRDELNYDNTNSSFFALRLSNDYNYVPDIDISYMNVQQNKNSELNTTRVITQGGDYNGTIRTKIDYSVLNVVLKSSFKYKGSMAKFWMWDFYTGDIEYNLGLNTKLISYRFDIEHADGSLPSFISVDSVLVLPYVGVKYYWYDFVAYAHGSALSFSEAKAINYEYGLDYRLIKGMYISASYMYEEFEATEKQDTVYFQSYGPKFSIKYHF